MRPNDWMLDVWDGGVRWNRDIIVHCKLNEHNLISCVRYTNALNKIKSGMRWPNTSEEKINTAQIPIVTECRKSNKMQDLSTSSIKGILTENSENKHSGHENLLNATITDKRTELTAEIKYTVNWWANYQGTGDWDNKIEHMRTNKETPGEWINEIHGKHEQRKLF